MKLFAILAFALALSGTCASAASSCCGGQAAKVAKEATADAGQTKSESTTPKQACCPAGQEKACCATTAPEAPKAD